MPLSWAKTLGTGHLPDFQVLSCAAIVSFSSRGSRFGLTLVGPGRQLEETTVAAQLHDGQR